MAETEAKSAGFASTQDMPWAARRVLSLVIRAMNSDVRFALRNRAIELRRRLSGAPHRVEYYHQVDDPYSHLAIQALPRLQDVYAVEFAPQLVRETRDANLPEPSLLASYARRDAAAVAPHYGLQFEDPSGAPSGERVQLAERIVAGAEGPTDFTRRAIAAGNALWSADTGALDKLAADRPPADVQHTESVIAAGSERRHKLGHYSSAMFLYGGEWFWGVDRLYHLERRLQGLGVKRDAEPGFCFPRPALELGGVRDAGDLTLEFYASLRSPYTAIAMERTFALARESGVTFSLRPVLPMVMRGVPVTLAKGAYIFMDTKREARADGVPFGNFIDPIGRPVQRCYSLYSWARERGKEQDLLLAFARGAFAEGVDTSRDTGLREVVERAGLSFEEAQEVVDNDDWQAELETNRLAMYDGMGLWGVPCFRIRGPAGEPDFSAWGNDRLWLVAAEIRRRSSLLRS